MLTSHALAGGGDWRQSETSIAGTSDLRAVLAWAKDELETLDNASILQAEESPLTSELLQAELAPLLALGRCRVVVSGPSSFNVAVAEMLEGHCQVDPDAITILEA